MKCLKCGGEGVITFNKVDKNGYFNDAFFMKECFVCNGTGEVEQTNEEWFSTLTTEGKAEVIAQLSSYGGNVEAILLWLKHPHIKESRKC